MKDHSASLSESAPIVSLAQNDKPSLKSVSTATNAWSPEEVRTAVNSLAALCADGRLDHVGRVASLEKLCYESRWTSRDLKAALKKELETAIARIKNETSTQVKSEPAVLDQLSEYDREAGKKLSLETDIFKVFHGDLETLGFPVNAYFACSILMVLISRLLDHSTGHIIYGASSSGKSAILSASLGLLPANSYVCITSMSVQAVYYLGDIKHKVLGFGEIKPFRDGEDDDRQMAMRQLISENKVTRAIPEKAPDNRMELSVKITEGPCTVTASTTLDSQSFNDEWVNRCYWIKSDDSEETTTKALDVKATRAARPFEKPPEAIACLRGKWQALNGSLEPLPVIIPYALAIKPTSKHVTVRRLYDLLLDYVRCSALLHQHTREKVQYGGVTYVIAAPADYRIAVHLLRSNAPRTLEHCGERAREAWDRVKQQLKEQTPFTQTLLGKLLKVPRSTAQGYLSQWLADGLVIDYDSKYGRQKKYACGEVDPSEQDLGLMPFDQVQFTEFDKSSVAVAIAQSAELPSSAEN